MASFCNRRRKEEKALGAHIRIVSQLKLWPSVAHLREGVKAPPLLFLIGEPINNIMVLYHGLLLKSRKISIILILAQSNESFLCTQNQN